MTNRVAATASGPDDRKVTMRDILRAVESVYDLTRDRLLNSRRRYASISRPRQVAMYLMRELTGNSYPQIGRFWCMDHTTVLHAHRIVSERIAAGEQRLIEHVDAVKAALVGKEPAPFIPAPRAELIRQIRDAIAIATEKLAELEAVS